MAEREPARRAVLLGASNLRGALPLLLDGLRRQPGGPLEVLAACGHGRSYGGTSRFLFVRRLPGIQGCGLWRALEERPSRSTLALITDVGNDLVYGYAPDRIAAWVETCLARLAAPSASQSVTIVMTLLPLSRLERLAPWQARLATSLLFPGRNAPWPDLLERARDLDARLRGIGAAYGAQMVEPDPNWYGTDPIHLRRGRRREAWASILGIEASPAARLPGIPLCPDRIEILGHHFGQLQPCQWFPDGSSLSLY